MYSKSLIESNFIEIMNTKQKKYDNRMHLSTPKTWNSWLQWKLHTIPNGQAIKRKEKYPDHGWFQ